MSNHNLMNRLSEEFNIPYNRGKLIDKFISDLNEMLPEQSYSYNTSKESYIEEMLRNILMIGKEK